MKNKTLSESTKVVAMAIKEINNRTRGRVPSTSMIAKVANKYDVDPDHIHDVGNWDRRSVCKKRKQKKRQ